jgi:hypothetical protein
MGKWTYHTSHSYTTEKGEKVSFVTQLYQVGVYGIINNDPSTQGCFTPAHIVSVEKALRKCERAGKITDLVFGTEIIVSDGSGLYEEVDS